ncbi:MAG: hypothetical protein HKL90_10400, partial [Elusimicrobia bacterium]|nr:hypothetical protein [Elusimicrobiota bacterium]
MRDRPTAPRTSASRQVLASILSAALVVQSAIPAFAGQFTVFRKTYNGAQREDASAITSDFGVLSASTTWALAVTNGDPSNPAVPKAEGAQVVLNGKRVLGERDFHPDVARDKRDLKEDARKIARDQKVVADAQADAAAAASKYGADSDRARDAQSRLERARAALRRSQSDQIKDEADLARDTAEQSGSFSVPLTNVRLADVLKARVEGRRGSQMTLGVVGQDNQPPMLTWLTPAASQVLQTGSVSAQLKLTDDVSGVDPATLTITLDTASVLGNFTALSAPTLSATLNATLNVGLGAHMLTANAKDKAGNAATAASVAFVYDVPPTSNAG